MPELKFVINDTKTGKSYSKAHSTDLAGMKIGDKLPGSYLGLNDFEFQITGGSDSAGFPMRPDISTPNRKSALLGSGPGVHIKRKGVKLRKTVRGNTIGANTVQVNIKIIKQGKQPIDKALGIEPKPKEKKEESKTPKEEPKIVEKQEESKSEVKKEEVKEQSKEQKKEEPKIEPSKEENKTEKQEEESKAPTKEATSKEDKIKS